MTEFGTLSGRVHIIIGFRFANDRQTDERRTDVDARATGKRRCQSCKYQNPRHHLPLAPAGCGPVVLHPQYADTSCVDHNLPGEANNRTDFRHPIAPPLNLA